MGLKKQSDSKRYEPPVIDLSNKNTSHALLVELTGSHKVVLEVGTSTGYISKILKGRGNRVVGIEIDPEAASIAKNYCDRIIVGNIENLDLEGLFEPDYFDVVMLGDVLEHLQWPDVFLGRIKRHLKPTGYLLISLPNIAHGDVILNLLMGKFQYTEAGLLDKTHFRFFTLKEIAEFFDTLGYQIADLHTTTVELQNTEVDVDWDSVPPEVLRFVKSLPHSNTYQFVFKAYLKENNLVSNVVSIARKSVLQGFIPFRDAYIASLEETLSQIYNLYGWRASRVYYRLRDRFFPGGSKRKRISKKMLAFLGKSFLYRKKTIFHWKQFGFGATLSKILRKLKRPKGYVSFHLHDDESRPEKTDRKVKPAVDIIIVTFNSAGSIVKCITGLLQSSYENPGGIIIVDNHSVDQTIEKIQALFGDARQSVQILTNQGNLGFGRAMNIGANHSQNELLLLLNPDTVVSPDVLSILVDTMEHFGKKCAAVEARQIPFEHPKLYNPVSMDVGWFSACCVLIRKAAFQKVGGFDENIFLYGEDVDLSLRLKNAGYAIKYCPRAVVSHEIDPHQPRTHQKTYGPLSNLYLRAKYRQKLSPWLFSMVGAIFLRDMPFPNPLEVFSYFYKGWSKKYPQKIDLKGCFPTVGFGYETLRRRGHDVSILSFPHEALVSVVLRTHDRPELLGRVLKNLAHQTYEKIEIIVVEDRTNTAPPVVEKFGNLNLRYFHYAGTNGRTGALNLGLLQARGDWIYCLDDDDVIFADTIETLLYHAVQTLSRMVYGGSLELLTDDKWTGFLRPGYFQAYDRERLKRENFIPVGTFLFHRQMLEKTGMFDEKLEILEDWDFLNRMAQKGDFTCVPKDFLIFLTPLDPQKRLERQRRLDDAYRQVVKKRRRRQRDGFSPIPMAPRINSAPDLSIIVVNYNSSAYILNCLAPLKEALAGKTHEVIVIDNHSADDSCQLIREKYPDVDLIQNKKNLGFGRAVNQGFRMAQGKYFLIINPDVTLTPGPIEKAINFLDAHPDVGLLLPKLVNPDGSLQFSCRTFYNFSTILFRRTPLGKIFPNHRVIRKHLMMDWNHEDIREVDWGLGACMLLRRETLKGENIFDERFFLYFEDVDLCFRMKKEGWKVIYYPEAVMVHSHVRQSADGFFNRAKWEHLKSLLKFYFKHRRLSPPVC